MLGVESLVDDLDVIDEADEEIGRELGDLVEVEGGEEPVSPAECGVCVDECVIVVGCV